ncbi:unnamed protein product, partial [Rotaria magnacalcarata]
MFAASSPFVCEWND